MIGNKTDIRRSTFGVDTKLAQIFAIANGIPLFFEISAAYSLQDCIRVHDTMFKAIVHVHKNGYDFETISKRFCRELWIGDQFCPKLWSSCERGAFVDCVVIVTTGY